MAFRCKAFFILQANIWKIMSHLIVEIKAKCAYAERIRTMLHSENARFHGRDHQIDTYFQAPHGRLKLREGNIENNLIHYHRNNQAGPKLSEVSLHSVANSASLKAVLTAGMEVLTVVDKERDIYFIDNVKFHIDQVQGLGAFVEIEAIDMDGTLGEAKIRKQCEHYLQLFGIPKEDLIDVSYSDMQLSRK